MRAAAAALREQYGVMLVAVFSTCYGVGSALEAAVGWVHSLTLLTFVVGFDVENNDVRKVDEGGVVVVVIPLSTPPSTPR